MAENIGENLTPSEKEEPISGDPKVPELVSNEVKPRKKRTTDVVSEEQILAETEGEKTEKELSPEELEKVMEKVQDINQRGVAYTSIGDFGFNKAYRSFSHELFEAEKVKNKNYALIGELKEQKISLIGAKKQELESEFIIHIMDILKFGVQGGVKMEKRKMGATTGKQWSQVLKNPETDKRVHFNIVGRSIPDHGGGKTDISNAYFSHIYNQEEGQEDLTITFDISDFEETDPTSNAVTNGAINPRKYRANDGSILNTFNFYKENAFPPRPDLKIGDPLLKKHGKSHKHEIGVHRHFDEEGKPMPDTEHGFVLTPRIPPRLFQGLVLGGSNESISKRVLQITKVMKEIHENKTKDLLPIYNQNGDLLWPESMSYEEVKKFVEEKVKEKEGE